METKEIKLEINWQEVIGYITGFCGLLYSRAMMLLGSCADVLPGSCRGWTDVFALLTITVTFIFITLPKVWDFQKKRWMNDINDRKTPKE